MLELLLGPLTGPECRRSAERGWVILVRALAALPPVAIVLMVAWLWFFKQQLNPGGTPWGLYAGAVVGIDAVAVTIAFALTPALVAGLLAGERARGTLELLLAAQVTARDIIVGRLAGRLTQVGLILAAGLPCWTLAVVTAGIDWPAAAALLCLPAAVALGAGGMAMAASVGSRRGRDALIAVYLVEVILLTPGLLLFLAPTALWTSLLSLNPYQGLAAAAFRGEAEEVWLSVLWWSGLGLLGIAWATARLRPVYLRRIGGPTGRPRRGRVPPLGENPMLWKEMHIERARALGRVGRLLGGLVVLVVLGGSVVLALAILWQEWAGAAPSAADDLRSLFAFLVGYTARPLQWIIAWGIGLRAGVAIASEREQATWEGLILSPLAPADMVRAKIAGSLYALRGLAVAVLAAWTIALLAGALAPGEYFDHLANVAVTGFFMAAAGVWSSLRAKTSTGAMTLTLLLWLAAWPLLAWLALLAAGLGLLVLYLGTTAWQTFYSPGIAPGGGGAWNTLFSVGWTVINYALYALAGLAFAWHGWRYFDHLAGRAPADPLRAAFIRQYGEEEAARTAGTAAADGLMPAGAREGTAASGPAGRPFPPAQDDRA